MNQQYGDLSQFVSRPVAEDPFDADPFFANIPKVCGARSGKIVPAAVNARLFDAFHLVAEAEKKAAEIDTEAQRITSQAYEEGLAAGRKEAQQELAGELNRLEREVETFFRNAEPMILELALDVARRFVAINMTEAAARQLMVETIRKHAASEPYAIHVGLQARATAMAALDDLKRSHPEMRLPVVRTDQRLDDHRAILMTRFGSADLDVDSQVRALAEQALDGPMTTRPTQKTAR